ncbi:MAG: hypothetical protein OSJ61_28855, partial [Lachnospiraceae bacterium]|nr:hypothetical protein [Lachnospiraceae bacterium]
SIEDWWLFFYPLSYLTLTKYRGIKREKDVKKKYILNSRLNTVFDDIESYIKYRIEREFR